MVLAGVERKVVNFKVSQVDVGRGATKIPTTNMVGRVEVHIFNNHATETLYVGNENVKTGTGYPILAQKEKPFILDADDQLYGIVASGTVDVRIYESYK